MNLDACVASRRFTVSLVLPAFLLVAVTAKAQFTPSPGSPFPLGAVATSMASGDFNGDGKPDLVVLTGTEVKVLIGDVSGAFTAGPASPSSGTRLVVADFNRDGKPDLLVTTAANDAVSVLLGNGSGAFTLAPAGPFAVPIGELTVGDFNGDGNPDVALSAPNTVDGKVAVTVLLGNGLGGFSTTLQTPLALGQITSLAAGDFNGDGKLDLAIGLTADNAVVLPGNGSGGFGAALGNLAGIAMGASLVAAGDFNGDGIQDVAVASTTHPGGDFSVLLGNRSGQFTQKDIYFDEFSQFGAILVGDFNGDHMQDVAILRRLVSVNPDTVIVLLGDGMGGFNPASASPIPLGTNVGSIVAADFNKDGESDLAFTTGTGNSVTVLLNSHPFITRGDLDGNGVPDLVWQQDDTNAPVIWYMGGADGSTVLSGIFLRGPQPTWRIVGVADLNRDGHQDLIWQQDGTNIPAVWYMAGDAANTVLSAKILGDPQPGLRIVGVGDLDGDGHPDLIWQEDGTDAPVVWYMGGADGGTVLKTINLRGPQPTWRIVGVTDLDGDGHVDLIWQQDGTNIPAVWYMAGDTANTVLRAKTLGDPQLGWRIVAVADMDRNGNPDLIWQQDDTEVPAVWYMGGADGSTVLSTKILGGPEPGFRIVGPK